MATRDILVLNTTASRAETQQGSDTVVIKGNSGEALSVENSSGTSILSVNTVSSSVNVAGKITATTDVSSSLGSSGSFGRLEATTLVGSAFNLTNTAIPGTISSSVRLLIKSVVHLEEVLNLQELLEIFHLIMKT